MLSKILHNIGWDCEKESVTLSYWIKKKMTPVAPLPQDQKIAENDEKSTKIIRKILKWSTATFYPL